MCGIFGYAGKQPAANLIHKGLKRLEYRGYDSWGIAVREQGKFSLTKHTGAIADATDISSSKATTGIGHTRWATHGGVTDINAHPHTASDGSFALAQNGIVENYQELQSMLEAAGHKFISETDTEIIVRLIEEETKTTGDLVDAVRIAFNKLEGRNTIIVLPLDNKGFDLLAIRNGSPLVAGKTDDGIFVASDTLSFADQTHKVLLLHDNEMILLQDDKIKLFDVINGSTVNRDFEEIDVQNSTIDKEGYDHFMLKEVHEQKHTIREAMRYSSDELSEFVAACKEADTIYTVGAGTAGYAAGQIAYYLRTIGGLKAIELKAYELDSFTSGFSEKDIIIAVSQSGETADTIEALELAEAKGVTIASIVNMQGTTIPRMSKYSFFTRSGPEICVVSTKAFTAQCAWGLRLAHELAGTQDSLLKLADDFVAELEEYLDNSELQSSLKELAKYLAKQSHVFVLGRGQNYYIALESALKIKETTYIHAEGFAAGELKHGVIALIEKGTPVIVFTPQDEHYHDMLSAASEVKARGAYVIGISSEENELFDMHIPVVGSDKFAAFASVIPMQIASYKLALELGLPPDKPRNLAKSVTVK